MTAPLIILIPVCRNLHRGTAGSGFSEIHRMSSYVSNCLYKKNKLEFDPYYTCGGNDGSVTLDDYGDKYHYSSKTLKLHGYDLSPNAPNRIWNNHIEWKRW